jgi:hypothetical protein
VARGCHRSCTIRCPEPGGSHQGSAGPWIRTTAGSWPRGSGGCGESCVTGRWSSSCCRSLHPPASATGGGGALRNPTAQAELSAARGTGRASWREPDLDTVTGGSPAEYLPVQEGSPASSDGHQGSGSPGADRYGWGSPRAVAESRRWARGLVDGPSGIQIALSHHVTFHDTYAQYEHNGDTMSVIHLLAPSESTWNTLPNSSADARL